MATIENYFEQAQLSLAAYALNLQQGMSATVQTDDYRRALVDAGMSAKQAEVFTTTYSVVDQFSDSLSGFSATVFEKAGVKYFAIRGTQLSDLRDFISDAMLAVTGVAATQSVALYNYYQRLVTPRGQPVAQLEFAGTAVGYRLSNSSGATGILDTPLTGPIGVTGHSLGGHLAMVFSRLFPVSAAAILTYNAPGFNDAGVDFFFGRIDSALGRAGSSFQDARTTNLYGNGLSIIAGFADDHGMPQEIFLEGTAHSIIPLTDSLALYEVMARIDSNASASVLSNVLKAASNRPTESLEAALDSLRKLFKDPNLPGITTTAINSRDQLYRNLYDTGFQQRIASYASQLQLSLLTGASATDLSNIAQGSEALAYRYALKELNPFAVLGNNAIYDQHNQDGSLNLTASGTSGMTPEYLADRAEMLSFLIQRNTGDLTIVNPGASGALAQTDYVDRRLVQGQVLGQTVPVVQEDRVRVGGGLVRTGARLVAFGSPWSDTFTGAGLDDRLYGGGGRDILNGQGGVDYIQGDSGDDVIEGGAGNDILVGGKGFDTYRWNTGDGTDTIKDEDRKGQVIVNGTPVRTALAQGSGVWATADGKVTLTQNSPLTIHTEDGSSIVLESFQDGDFGIQLRGELLNPTPTNTISGDLEPQIFTSVVAWEPINGMWGWASPDTNIATLRIVSISENPRTALVEYTKYNDDGYNLVVTSTPAPDRSDIFSDTPADDLIRGFGGNDAIWLSHGGSDWIQAGTGDDTVGPSSGVLVNALLIEGGLGADRLWGTGENDEIYAEDRIALTDALSAAVASIAPGDRIYGLNGDDLLVGSTSNDHIEGDGNADLIIASAGDDTVYGDSYEIFNFYNWYSAAIGPDGADVIYGGSGNDTINGQGGADFIDGGSDDDVIYGENGADFIDGGSGADVLVGSIGDDMIVGGTGDDVLYGDETDETGYLYSGNDYLDAGAGNDVIQGDGGDDILIGGEGDDVLDGDYENVSPYVREHWFFYGITSNDVLNGGNGNDVLWGRGGNDELDGGIGVDTLHGGDGNDVLDGGAGNDVLDGEEGDDVYVFDVGDGVDTLIETRTGGTDTLVFGSGISPDMVELLPMSSLIRVGENDDQIGIRIVSAIETFVFDDGLQLTFQELLGPDFAAAPTSGDNILDGRDGNDVIDGLQGNDLIMGYLGDDQLTGGDGADEIYGDEGADTLLGDGGNDLLDGGAGIDIMQGGLGDDTYVLDEASDVAVENEGEGIDTFRVSFSFDLPANVENLTLTGASAIDGTGNALDNVLIGNGSANVLIGGTGNDTLDGGAGADTMAGGAGDDTYVVDNYFDAVIENPGEGTDSILSSRDYTLAAEFENLTLAADATSGIGNAGDNVLTGNATFNYLLGDAGNDRLEGAGGDDDLDGGEGSDVYVFRIGDGVDSIFDSGFSGTDTLLFGAGISPDTVTLGLGSLLIRVGANGDAVHIRGFNVNNPLAAPMIENFVFGDGTQLSYAELLARGFDIVGTAEADWLSGGDLDERMYGLEGADNLWGAGGNDRLEGGAGDDRLTGYTGNDHLVGGTGSDFYSFDSGFGSDVIVENDTIAGDVDTVFFGMWMVTPISAARSGMNLQLTAGNDRITVQDWFVSDANKIEQIYLPNRTVWDVPMLRTLTNFAPVVANAVPTVSAGTNASFEFTPPADIFVDADYEIGDTLAYSATLADGSALPAWLRFNAALGTFSGTPVDADIGTVSIKITAADAVNSAASTIFDLVVYANVNHAPVLVAAIAEQSTAEDAPFSFTVPAGSFSDDDAGDTLTFVAALADGAALPGWLTFDPATRSFGGQPGNDDVGVHNVRVTATDGSNASASGVFALTVTNVNDAPTLMNALADQDADEDNAFSFAVPANTFADIDAADTLTISATLANGDPLPSWLSFDAATRSFAGTPGNADVGTLSVSVKAADSGNLSASDTFDLTVVNVNDAPTLDHAITAVTTDEDAAFAFAVPADTFGDVDIRDALSYSASLSGGDALPGWLSFDAINRSFTGTPTNSDVGTVSIRITATDSGNLSVSDAFDLTVVNVNDAPTLANTLADHDAMEYAPFSVQVPADAFVDVDVGDTLTYNATLADGSALPGWLAFDAGTRTFSGTPARADVGALNVKVMATDSGSLSAFDIFSLAVTKIPGQTLVGTAGNDTLNGGGGDDTLDGRGGSDRLLGNGGDDTFQYFVDGKWTAQFVAHNEGSPGNPGTNKNAAIAGKNRSHDVFQGGPGTDVLIGTSSDDALFLDDRYSPFPSGREPRLSGIERIEGGSGSDVIDLTSRDYGYGDVTLDGGDGNDVLWASGGTDVLLGGPGNDELFGGAGNDHLSGGTGADTMIGGVNDDTYVVDNARDVITENTGAGVDTVLSSINYTLGNNVENLTLTGDSGINGTGNKLNNVIIGNSATNTLNGGAGADTMSGGAGDDTYTVDNASDVVTENAGEGFDTINSSVSRTISANVEKLVLTGTSAIHGTGGTDDDYIVGNSAKNSLTGGAGNDLLNGAAGNDTVKGDTGNDVLEGMNGNDALADTGGNNLFNGGLGADTMTGNTGNELFIGDAGNDTITTNTGADIIAFNRGDGQDTINASTGADNTLSIGGGIRYADMTFTRKTNNLILNLGGSSEKITLTNWYASPPANKSVLNLQVIAQAMADFNASSTDPLLNRKVSNFDFLGLASAFDAAGAPANWALTHALLAEHLSGSNIEALGGDLAYRYGLTSSLANIGFDPAVSILSDASFGTAAQAFQSQAALEQDVRRLS